MTSQQEFKYSSCHGIDNGSFTAPEDAIAKMIEKQKLLLLDNKSKRQKLERDLDKISKKISMILNGSYKYGVIQHVVSRYQSLKRILDIKRRQYSDLIIYSNIIKNRLDILYYML